MKLLTMPRRDGAPVGNEGGVLSVVWATEGALATAVAQMQAEAVPDTASPAPETAPQKDGRATPVFRVVLAPGTAFYRSYTEAMLRRYGVLRMENGRVPSLLGREMFRGKVTSYRVQAFDDVVIFVHDIDQCLRLLEPEQQRLILRIGVQEYTFAEAAAMFQLTLRSVQRRYLNALDELTTILLRRGLLERVATDPCQEGGAGVKLVSHTPATT